MSDGVDRTNMGCRVVELPEDQQFMAAQSAIVQNPQNRPGNGEVIEAPRLVLYTSKYWGVTGVRLTVGFMEETAADLRDRILSHFNAWGAFGNIVFSWTKTDPQVRITRALREGYWSNLGTDILLVPKDRPTMCLQQFTMNTPEREYRRALRHEVGHTLGCPHEHLRPEEVQLLDPAKTIAYFLATQGWDERMTRGNVLTPLNNSDLLPSINNPADSRSIMCYQLPAAITKNGQPIPGGDDINAQDADNIARYYPKATPPGSKIMTKAQYETLRNQGLLFDKIWKSPDLNEVCADVNNQGDVEWDWKLRLLSYPPGNNDPRNAQPFSETPLYKAAARSGLKRSDTLKTPPGNYSVGIAVEGVGEFVLGEFVDRGFVPPPPTQTVLNIEVRFEGVGIKNPTVRIVN